MASNNYIPEYVLSDLPWYDRDGLITWYDQRKGKRFLRNPKNSFKSTKIVNFDIIRKQTAEAKIPDETFKKIPDSNRKKDLKIS